MFSNKVADQRGKTEGAFVSEFSPEMVRDANSPSRLGGADMRNSDVALNSTEEKAKISDTNNQK
jgi:hypothetical protein